MIAVATYIEIGNTDIELIDGDRGKNYPHQNELRQEGDCVFLSANNVTTDGFKFDNVVYITAEKDRALRNGKIQRGDIVITTRGTVGNVAYYNQQIPYDNIRINSGMLIVRCHEQIKSEFLYYVLRGVEFQRQIKQIQTGTAQPQLPKSHFIKMKIIVPTIDVQEKIAKILRTIDEKIESNKCINENLEQQIEMLLLNTINNADTQPVKLGDYLYIKGRIGWKGLKKSEYLPFSDYRIINGESLTLSGIDWNKAGYISAERYEESPEIKLNIGDILLSKDGTIGKIGYVDKLETPTSVASGIFVIRNTRQAEISTQFIYYLLKSRLFKAFITSRTEGSVIPHLYQKDFMGFEFQLPSSIDMKIFDDTTAAMFSMVFSNLNENERLIHLRDSLLPKLMSGELDISNLDL